jgi:hypothetical protein
MILKIPKIVRVETKPNYQLRVTFHRFGVRLFDVSPYLEKGVFKELKDEKYFRKVRVVWGGIEWPHEQDLSAETLYCRGIAIKKSRPSSHR